jgi:DNA repair exonuclease SbcCD ATPase subunit
MNANKNQELIIVNAISQMVIPTDIFEKSEFKQAINDFKSAQESVKKSLDSVESKRNEVKEGNFLGNWWSNREAALQDAQLDLNKSIGLLTKQSSDLILFNTAISKVLVSQQKILHEQQELLKKQAAELASQNKCIEKQQVDLSEQQERLLEVNKGLLEAKGITREHAEKLVGCVKRVETAEQKMELSNQELERSVAARIVACEERAESIKTEVDEALYNYRQEAAVRLEALSSECNSAVEGLRSQLSNFELKVNAESEIRKLAVTSVAEEFNCRVSKQSPIKN